MQLSHLQSTMECNPQPCLIREGVYGASFNHYGKVVYLRMEELTPQNSKYWTEYTRTTMTMSAKSGVIMQLFNKMQSASDVSYLDSEKRAFGWNETEFQEVKRKISPQINVPCSKVETIILETEFVPGDMVTKFDSKRKDFIVYATTNPNFSIVNDAEVGALKSYFDKYQDLLICVGSCFKNSFLGEDEFRNLGIFRNPCCVLNGEFGGLSMPIHAFTGAVAEQFFPLKDTFRVRPLYGMQKIIQHKLQAGDGYCIIKDQRIDIKDLDFDPRSETTNLISICALVRLYKGYTSSI